MSADGPRDGLLAKQTLINMGLESQLQVERRRKQEKEGRGRRRRKKEREKEARKTVPKKP